MISKDEIINQIENQDIKKVAGQLSIISFDGINNRVDCSQNESDVLANSNALNLFYNSIEGLKSKLNSRIHEPLFKYINPFESLFRNDKNSKTCLEGIIPIKKSFVIVAKTFFSNGLSNASSQYQNISATYLILYSSKGIAADILLIDLKESNFGSYCEISTTMIDDKIQLSFLFKDAELSASDPLQGFSVSGTGSSKYKIENDKFVLDSFQENIQKEDVSSSNSESLITENLFYSYTEINFQDITNIICQFFQRQSPADFIQRPYTDLAGGLLIASSAKLRGYFLSDFQTLVTKIETEIPGFHQVGQAIIGNVEAGKYQDAYDHTLTWMRLLKDYTNHVSNETSNIFTPSTNIVIQA
ncbi:MAG: hypothetical protein MUF43_07360 [Flavobacterium sp.]|jgi:hypothetical protein|nr:hypothetical protein [Flavobacterium sp.]